MLQILDLNIQYLENLDSKLWAFILKYVILKSTYLQNFSYDLVIREIVLESICKRMCLLSPHWYETINFEPLYDLRPQSIIFLLKKIVAEDSSSLILSEAELSDTGVYECRYDITEYSSLWMQVEYHWV